MACALTSLATFNRTNIDLETYHTLFKEKLRILEEFGLDFGTPQMGDAVYKDAEKRWGGYNGRTVKLLDLNERKKAERDQVAAQLFLKNCGKQYKNTQKLFSSEYSRKRYNKFPRDITDMTTYLSEVEPKKTPKQNDKSNDKNDADQNNNNQQQKSETNNPEKTQNSKNTTEITFAQNNTDFNQVVDAATPPDNEQPEKSLPTRKDDRTGTQQPSAGHRKDGTAPQQGTARQQECASSLVNNNNDDNTKSPVKNDKGEFICYNYGRAGQCIMQNCPHKTKENGEPTVLAKQQSATAESFLMTNKCKDVLDDAYYKCAYDFSNVKNTTTLDLQGKDHVFNNCDDKQRLPDLWMLLDNQSTVHIFWNTMFLVNV